MLAELKNKFRIGEISKREFIDQMFQINKILYEYSDATKDTDIKEIRITEEGVYFTSKEEGIILFCNMPDKRTAPFEIINFDSYESAESRMIYSLIQNGDNVFDIGANIGWYTLNIGKKFPESTVYSFEPVPLTFNSLKKNLELNNLPNVKSNNIGFSNVREELTFYINQETSVSSSSENIEDNINAMEVKCQVQTLDEFDKLHSVKIDFIKCDVEGAELFVFQGGIDTISKYQPVIFTEMLRKWSSKFDYHPNDIISLLKAIGYSCYKMNNGWLEPIKEVNEETIETNFIFLHEVKHSEVRAKFGQV